MNDTCTHTEPPAYHPLPSCWYCGRARPELELASCCARPCCAGVLACRDVADCRDFLLAQLNAVRE